jgi:pyruvate dehydrogenase E2 component (dihydrolipoamide acetyltransferase)
MNESVTVLALTPMRRAIATRMSEASRSIPHFRVSTQIELDPLLRLRADLQQRSAAVPSINAFLIKASAGALMEVPEINIQWADTAIHRFATADISIVVSVPGGLSTPIVRSANFKSVLDIGNEMKGLAARASKNDLRMEEIMGGSFTISNLGMYDVVEQFDAIINSPQCAILAVGAAAPRLIACEDGSCRVATSLRATLSVDHRAIDGVLAAQFLTALRRRVETPTEIMPMEDSDVSRPAI